MSQESELALAPPPLPEFYGVPQMDVPSRTARLADGREVTLSGEPGAFAGHSAASAGAAGSLVLAARLLASFGIHAGEAALAGHAGGDEGEAGGLPLEELAEALAARGLPAHVERGYSIEDLAHAFESGAGVLLAVNAGELHQDAARLGSGECNDSVLLAAVAREPHSGEVLGLYVQAADGGPTYLSAEPVARGWLETGGWHLVTDLVNTDEGV